MHGYKLHTELSIEFLTITLTSELMKLLQCSFSSFQARMSEAVICDVLADRRLSCRYPAPGRRLESTSKGGGDIKQGLIRKENVLKLTFLDDTFDPYRYCRTKHQS